MQYGCAWYPEHWDETRWAEDLRLMREAGMTVVRIGEFAWSRLEPEEGRYDLDWLERAVALAAAQGLRSVVGTPTATPPAWLTQRYPEVLAVRESGQRELHGARCHYSPTSPRYLGFCSGIAEVLARRFGQNPHVMGWQIDNEYWSYSYDPYSVSRFQVWLKDRYGTLERLNHAWTNSYWSEDYFDWTQIPPPKGNQNPCLLQAWKGFMTDVYVAFQRTQVDAIRRHADPRQWITHNIHAHERLDWRRIAQDLDWASYDPYIGTGHLVYHRFGFMDDACRGFKRAPFWIMETQPGSVNWSAVNTTLNKGETRRLAWHHVGHGAEAVLWWQWRAALGGQEQYHGCVVAPDGTPRPLYAEVAQVGREFAASAKALAGSVVETDVALLWSYSDRWAIQGQRHHKDFDPMQHWGAWYGSLRQAGVDVDVLDPSCDLSKYRLVLAPSQHILSPGLAANLVRYVRGGGCLILGPRSGFKNEENALLQSKQPGTDLGELLGARVEEFYALDSAVPVDGEWGAGTASIWAEYLSPQSADVRILLAYGACNGWLDGQPAAVTRTCGKGRIAYVGAWLDESLMRKMTDWALENSGVEAPLGRPPEGVEVCRRMQGKQEVYVLMNHGKTPVSLRIPGTMRNILSDSILQDSVLLPANDVCVAVPTATKVRKPRA